MQAIYFEDMVANCVPQILDEIYGKCVYEPFLKGRTGLVILDVGANIGLFSHYVLDKGYAKYVLAVEPDKDHSYLMRRTLNSSFYSRHYDFIEAAVSDTDGEVLFHSNPGNLTMHNIIGGEGGGKSIPGVSMETVLSNLYPHENGDPRDVDFMKLDVEGAEGLIVCSESFQRAAPRIKEIVGEYHEWCPVPRTDLVEALVKAGYTFNWIDTGDGPLTLWHAKRSD